MHTRVGNLILFLLFPLPQFLLFLLTCCFSWQLHRSSTTGCFNSISSNSCFCLFLYNPRGLLRSLCNSGAWSSDPTPFMVSQVPKTHSCVGFLCTSAAIGLFGQRWLCQTSCSYFAAQEQDGDCVGLQAGFKSVKQLFRLKSYSFLLALKIFSFKAVWISGCMSTDWIKQNASYYLQMGSWNILRWNGQKFN